MIPVFVITKYFFQQRIYQSKTNFSQLTDFFFKSTKSKWAINNTFFYKDKNSDPNSINGYENIKYDSY